MKLEEEQHSLALWAQRCIREGLIHQLIDPHFRTQMSPYCLKVFVEVAMKCLRNYSKDRPTMEDVVGTLESLELALAAQKRSSSWTEEAISINGGADNEQIVCGLNNEPLSVKRPKSTITKLVQSMVVTAKGKDLQRKKPKDHGLDSSAGASSWWWPWKPSTNSTKKPNGRRLPPLPEDLCRHFSLAEIQAATNNFDCNLIIRHGSIGELYKGYIDNGSLVVVIRRLKPGSHLARQCWDKVAILAELHHINLLSPIGYCGDGGEMILVYDYLGNGSLHDHLFGMHNDPLPWKRRLEICIGIGQGLQYLHAGTRHTVIHCDIKSANVLLDHNWVPKFSFLKSSILLEPSSMATAEIIGGTFGYEALECIKDPVTEKIDVYSLGIVLLQVLSGLDVSGTNWTSVDYFRSCVNRKCVDPTVLQYRHLVSYFRGCIDRKCIVHIIDPYLMGKIPPECFWVYVKVLWSCLHYQGFKRPSMDDVVRRLQLALQLLETSGDNIRFGGESEVDKTDMSYKEVVAQAYNDALFSDSKPFFIDSDCFAPSTSQLGRASRVPFNLCKKHSDYCPCNLSR
ncbi:hypothetical protein Vadar_014685 [Vaccinium darrowii]|uniref:Uncharacterized protein n=1 Tax=Vaccinium darrowii TaxID=229202 RepID=A0ACB7XZV3_9ERIC|nr:hypothetical protein Vadar_014685 [Vaccinium darrowii]